MPTHKDTEEPETIYMILAPLTAFIVRSPRPGAEWQLSLWITDTPWSWIAR